MSDVAAEIKVGDTAPDFKLKDQDQKDVKLSEYRGKKNVVLAFYPLDWSPVCTGREQVPDRRLPAVSRLRMPSSSASARTASSPTRRGPIRWTSSTACWRILTAKW